MSKDAVSEDTEHDEVKVILNKHGITKLDDIELGTPHTKNCLVTIWTVRCLMVL